jgi:hypothetical protein
MVNFVVTFVYYPRFGMLYQEKSGNPAIKSSPAFFRTEGRAEYFVHAPPPRLLLSRFPPLDFDTKSPLCFYRLNILTHNKNGIGAFWRQKFHHQAKYLGNK